MSCREITHVAGQVLLVTAYRACSMELVTELSLCLSKVSCRSDLSFSIDMLPIAAEVASSVLTFVVRHTEIKLSSKVKALGSPSQLAMDFPHYSTITTDYCPCIQSCQTGLTFSEYLASKFVMENDYTSHYIISSYISPRGL